MHTSYTSTKLVTGTDLSKRRIPKMVMDSGKEGPAVWLTGCIHGDEIGGTVLIHEIFKILRKSLWRGRVSAFPIVNPFGFEALTRLLPYSKEDLNRLFPGKSQGSLGERIVFTVFNDIFQDKPDLVLDFHNDWIRSIPYTLIDNAFLNVEDHTFKNKLEAYARVLGFPVIIDTEYITGSLSGSLLKRGIPALTVEVGESFSVNEAMTRKGVAAVMRLFYHLEMIEEGDHSKSEIQLPEPEMYFYESNPLSSTSGILRFHTREGAHIRKGQVIARVYNAFGKSQETLCALHDGIVLGRTDHALSFPGFPVMAFGIRNSKRMMAINSD